MANYVMEKRIPDRIHNVTTLVCDNSNVYLDRVTGINKNGNEILLYTHGDYLYGNVVFIYANEDNLNTMRIYYSNIAQLNDTDIKLVSSYSKYAKSGTIKTEEVTIPFSRKIAIDIDYENLGDAHISAVVGIAIDDENGENIYGKDIFLPVSSDSVLYDPRIVNDAYSMYGYIDDKLIEDSALLVDRDDILRFIIPKNTDKNITLFGNNISIDGVVGSLIRVNVEIRIINTNFTLIDHTPVIKRIGMVAYDDNQLFV
jgi:hypothetical protein